MARSISTQVRLLASRLSQCFNSWKIIEKIETEEIDISVDGSVIQECPPPWEVMETHDDFAVSRLGSCVKICLTRAGRGNSLTLATINDISALYRRVAYDQSLHQIVLTGQGKYFCTGMDLHENLFLDVDQRFKALAELFEAIDTSPQTTIAAINGPAFGGGVGLAFVCDIRIATTSAKMCLSEVRLGLCPSNISKYVVREWGPGLARMAILSAAKIEPERLYSVGTVHTVVSDAKELELAMTAWLQKLSYTAPKASSLCKNLVRELCGAGRDNETSEVAREIFEMMLAEGSESTFGVAQFKKGHTNIEWLSRKR